MVELVVMATQVQSPPEFLTVREAAALLRLGVPQTYRLIHAGKIPAIRIYEGNAGIRIPVGELYELLYRPATKE